MRPVDTQGWPGGAPCLGLLPAAQPGPHARRPGLVLRGLAPPLSAPVSDPQHLISPQPGPGGAPSPLRADAAPAPGAESGAPVPSVCLGLLCRLSPVTPGLLGHLVPGFPFFHALSPSLRADCPHTQHPGCHGNTAAGTRWWLGAGSRRCCSLRHFQCQAPARRSGWGSFWGALRASQASSWLMGGGEKGGTGARVRTNMEGTDGLVARGGRMEGELREGGSGQDLGLQPRTLG